MIRFIDGGVELHTVGLIDKAAHPDVGVVILLGDKGGDNHHPFADLKGDDLFFHQLDPFVALAGFALINTQFKKHYGYPLVNN